MLFSRRARPKSLLIWIGLLLVFRSTVADWNYIPSSSMNPTILAGDRVLVDKRAYSLRLPFTLTQLVRWRSPARGDVITFHSPSTGHTLIKRVVAVAGDVVAVDGNVLILNGSVQRRTLVEGRRLVPTEDGPVGEEIWKEHLDGRAIEVARLPEHNRWPGFAPVRVPDGHVMVMGDNRDGSIDSRYIGFIHEELITGRAVRVVLSHREKQWRPRAERFWLLL